MGEYIIGQRFPLERKTIFGNPITPVWFIFRTKPQKESSAKAWLRNRSVEAWFPVEQGFKNHGKSGRKVILTRRIAPGYVWAHFKSYPHWYEILKCPYISKVVTLEGCPLALTDTIVARMRECPGRLHSMQKKQQAAEQARREAQMRALMFFPGDTAIIKSGVFEGKTIEVARVNNGLVHFITTFLGQTREMQLSDKDLTKVS